MQRKKPNQAISSAKNQSSAATPMQRNALAGAVSPPQSGEAPRLSEDRVLSSLNQIILDHLEISGHAKIAKLLKEEIIKGNPGPGLANEKMKSIQSAKNREKVA